jgi:hypothetical protein
VEKTERRGNDEGKAGRERSGKRKGKDKWKGWEEKEIRKRKQGGKVGKI